jgi:hypothetical protein
LKLKNFKKMKKSTYKIATFALVVVLVLSGCDKLKDFGSTNVDPSVTNTPNTSALLTSVLTGVGGFAGIITPALYAQYYSETQYPDVSCYSANTVSPQINYSGGGTATAPTNLANLEDLQNIIKTNTDAATAATAALNGANDNQIAIARILKAYIFWNMTDRWGDIPYSEALKGIPDVAYDTQESIYKDLLKELTEAVAQFTSGAPIKGDIAYNGDITKWQKLANSMRMLMALRLSKRYPNAGDYAATQFNAALNDAAGSIATNADNFQLTYPGGHFQNPFYVMYDGRHDYGESNTMTNLLGSFASDARLSVFGATSAGAPSTKGVPYGRARSAYSGWVGIDAWCGANADYAYVLNPNFRAQTSPIFIVHAASVLLARAEAADRGWTTENFATLYTQGINTAYELWGLPDPAATYFAVAGVALGAKGTNLQQIATQEYIAYYPDGVQGWSTWRRTNYPALTPAIDGTNTPKVIPRRYMYGPSDYSLTAKGIATAVANLGSNGDKMDSRIWWDQ